MNMPLTRKRRTTNLYRTAQRLARQTWKNLHDSEQLGISLSEESITDFLLLQFARAHPREVTINKFSKADEGHTTGADWEWWFGVPSAWFGMRVQAKKLDYMKYAGLLHTVSRTKRKQVNLLIRSAKNSGLCPFYCFYNYWGDRTVTLGQPTPHSGDSRLQGCAVADAFQVRRRINKGLIRLSDIAPIAMPLDCLFGSTTSSITSTLPIRIRDSVSTLAEIDGR